MDGQIYKDVLDKLANKEIESYTITQENFLEFREQLVKREDFKHFRGNAQHNGVIIYTYLDVPRS
ncbi:abortive phage infection protein [Bacillus massiliglaciei]|uniref:abortive phage infection protein n=1 Tax=Bacillus massiliglaciei TaxID=1816693 RepID=UPI000DA5EC98|nr:abortive phage infection protein [Bacillus massiliglaciei]